MPALVICGAPAAGRPGPPPRPVDPASPVAPATDLGLTRGDGVFESVGIHGGRLHHLEPHLERLAQSAATLDMPPPDAAVFREATVMAAEALLASLDTIPGTALCKLVYTRGTEAMAALPSGGEPFGFVYADAFPDPTPDRTHGVDVITLTRGYPKGVGESAPWLLAGAKTLSYAVNMAALRHGAAHGAKDVIFTTTDQFVLEAPRSSVLVRHGGVILTPAIEAGLLHGTAQRAAFDAFEDRGFTCDYRDVTVEQLTSADAVWLTDSIQLVRPVRRLDGRQLPVDGALTGAVNADILAGG